MINDETRNGLLGRMASEVTRGGIDPDSRFDNGEDVAADVVDRFDTPVYTPPSKLKLPVEVKNKLNAQGYAHRWVRFYLNGKVDAQNIRKKMSRSEGYTFVRPTELEEEELYAVGDVQTDTPYGDIIMSDDCVLMKTRIENAEARRKHYQKETRRRSDANKQRLRENQIHNDSRSVVRTGKNAHFSQH